MRLFERKGIQDGSNTINNSSELRINIFFFSTFIIFCVIILRLAVLQFVEGSTLTEAEANRDTKIVPLSAIRGNILAAEGEELAYSTPVQSLYLTLQKEYTATKTDKTTKKTTLTAEADHNSKALAGKLAEAFETYGDPNDKKITTEEILEAMDLYSKKSSGYVARRIKSGLSKKEIAYFLEHKNEYPNLEVLEESSRHYDTDTVAVQAVGYVKFFKSSTSLDLYKDILQAMKNNQDPGLNYKEDELVGFDGLELQYQKELRGQNGYKEVSVDPQNMAEKIVNIEAPVKGSNIWTTINKKIQLKTEEAIKDQIQWLHSHTVQGETHPDALTGYAVAMEVDTGNIITMASMPDYDTNYWATGSILPEKYEQIEKHYQNGTITPFSSGRSGHNFESTVLLGSTIKPLSVLIGLKEGFINTSSTYQDKGITSFGREGHETFVRNSSNHVYGSLYPHTAIEKSSNVYMVDMIGKKLYDKYKSKAIGVWDTYMKEFGLGIPTGIGLPREYLGDLNYKAEAKAGSVQSALVYASFGQQGRYTVLQLAQYAATLANEGQRIKPQLVSKITDSNGKVIKEFKREVLDEVTNFDKSFWREIKKGMNSDVKSAFGDFPYDFARKTGTSQQTDSKKINRDNGVFIAFAPRENPKLAVAVVIPEGGFGSNSAAPVARKIFDAYDWEYGLDGIPKKNIVKNMNE